MPGRSGLIGWLIAAMLTAPFCPLVCEQVQIPPARDLAPAPQGSCHEKSVPAGDPLSHPDPDTSPGHSCEHCTHLQQPAKSGKGTPAIDSVFPASGFLVYLVPRSSDQQPARIERLSDSPASPPGIESILRI